MNLTYKFILAYIDKAYNKESLKLGDDRLVLTISLKKCMIIPSSYDGGQKKIMEDSSTRIEDPEYLSNIKGRPSAFFGVFFCFGKEVMRWA